MILFGVFQCGHNHRIYINDILGKKIGYEARYKFENNQCPKCIRKEMEENKWMEIPKLPKLTGSKKQVEWANDLREEFLDNWANLFHMYRKAELNNDPIYDNPKHDIEYKEKMSKNKIEAQLIFEYIIKINSAKWFIDHRGFMNIDRTWEEGKKEMELVKI